jgi:hypothetical protein
MNTAMSKPGINDFHNSNFRVTLSNFPGLNDSDLHIFHNNIRSIQLPGFTLETFITKNMGKDHLHNMGSRQNDNLGDLSITYKLSESLLNYFHIANYIESVKHQKNISNVPKQKDNNIGSIIVELLSNQKTPVCRIHYKDVVLSGIDGLALDYTNGAVMTFTSTMKFEQMQFELLD